MSISIVSQIMGIANCQQTSLHQFTAYHFGKIFFLFVGRYENKINLLFQNFCLLNGKANGSRRVFVVLDVPIVSEHGNVEA